MSSPLHFFFLGGGCLFLELLLTGSGRRVEGADVPASTSQHTSPAASHEDEDDEQQSQSVVGEGTSTQQQQQQPGNGGGGDANDPKRSRACEACRGLKVRCEPALDDGPCKRCKKAGRECVVTAPSRKRQRKTDSRVSELERKIDALTASLHAKNAAAAAGGGGAGAGGGGTPHGHEHGPAAARESPLMHRGSSIPESSTTRHGSADRQAVPARSHPPSTPSDHASAAAAAASSYPPPLVMAGQKRKASERSHSVDDTVSAGATPRHAAAPSLPWGRSLEPDVVDRGVITMDLAAELFARFRDRMVPHLPLIVFPPSLTVAELRRTRPIVFLAVMTAASSERGTLQKALQRELLPIFADRVFLTGDKSLDLVQSLLISTVWYCPPDNFEELKFYQLVHTAAIMAIDIGLGRQPVPGPARKNNSGSDGNILNQNWQTHPFRRHPLPDVTSIESRRTWLACFFMTSNAAIALRRPNMVRWTPFMAESVEILETSPDAAPSDRYLCHLVWTHRLTEDIAAQFNLEDPSVITDVNEPRTQHVLRALERDMDRYHASLPEDLARRPTLRMSFNMVSLWLHEVVLHNKTAADQLRPPFNTDTFKGGIVALAPLSAAQVSAVSACIASADALFTTFLSLDVATIRCLPAYNYVRVAYSLVILLKMYFSASNPASELGRVVDKDSLKVEYYLSALQDKFRLVAADDGSRVAAKFIVVLTMLSVWLAKQMRADNNKEPGSGGAGPSTSPPQRPPSAQQQQQPPPPQQAANTPLQLLSEVAAGTSTETEQHPRASAPFLNLRQAPQPFFYDTPPSTSTATATPDMQRSSAFQPPPEAANAAMPQQQQQQQQQQQGEQQWMGSDFIPNTAPLGEEAAFYFSMGYTPDAHMTYDQAGGPGDAAMPGMTGLNNAFFNDMFMGLHEPTNIFPF